MATPQWKDFPADILSKLTKLLNTDVDYLRLRSVCSSWRSSLPRLNKPFSFPLKLPPLNSPSDLSFFQRSEETNDDGDFLLNEITLYRLSPSNTEEESFNGWLFNAMSHSNPSSFSLIKPVTMEEMGEKDNPNIPKSVNLLDYRVSEIGKYHTVNFTGENILMMMGFKKAIALLNYVTGFDFVALVLQTDGSFMYWKLGDEGWTELEIGGLHFQDVILCDGKCYAVDGDGLLVVLDSELNGELVVASRVKGYKPTMILSVYLLKCNSDLYLVTMDSEDLDLFAESFESDFHSDEYSTPQSRLILHKYNECNDNWETIEDLSCMFFILSDYASHGFYAKDFTGFKGSRVYLNDKCFSLENKYGNEMIGLYHVEGPGQDICPPSWLNV